MEERSQLIVELIRGSNLGWAEAAELADLILETQKALREVEDWERRGVWGLERAEFQRAVDETVGLAQETARAIEAAGWSPLPG